MLLELRRRLRYLFKGDESQKGYSADGMFLTGKNLAFLSEQRFSDAWEFSKAGNKSAWEAKRQEVPDVRFRIHTAIWAAERALNLRGDFVEFGVNAGFLSMAVCEYHHFQDVDRKFWLFDTYAGIPTDGLSPNELKKAEKANSRNYSDVFELAKRNFSRFPNAMLVRGNLPGTIDDVKIDSIAYLSIDLNSATYEKLSIDKVWDRVVTGAPIVLDDYAFAGCEDQNEMWNRFAHEHDQSILTLPTGQGLIIKR
ncbi:TylF/MycF/NovP-related O-methyltransferase [Agrobacterium cavarae]|uniref:TylF/MycF/NovP-related O-methyltransferase n=1 Tax=Agrobacterium cavarae TaxID=2528239 RepID=UPI002FDA349C